MTVTTVGTGPSGFVSRRSPPPANPGDTNIKVNSTFGMTAGARDARSTPAPTSSSRTIQTVGTAGAGGTGVTLTAPLTLAHAVGATALDLGTRGHVHARADERARVPGAP